MPESRTRNGSNSILSDPSTLAKLRHDQAKKISIAEKVAEEEGKALARLKEFGHRIVILVAVGLGLTAFFLAQADETNAYQTSVSICRNFG